MILPPAFYSFFFLCWGSFLNVIAYRLVHEKSFFAHRSSCPHCNTIIAWYDLVPVVSWFVLKGHCRTCHQPISILYPIIELMTAFTFSLLYLNLRYDPYQFTAYFIFISALIITIRSDLETMLISRYVTLFLIPIGILCSALNLITISPTESICGALSGYGFLLILSKTFTYFTGKQGIGQGDLDLLGFIGAFLGFVGWWMALLIGSIAGSCIGTFYLLTVRPSNPKIPFGPFLAGGAILFIFFEPLLTALLFNPDFY